MEFDSNGQIKKIIPTTQGVKPRPIQLILNILSDKPTKPNAEISMEAQVIDFKAVKIEIYANGNKIGEVAKGKSKFRWKSVPSGFYQIYAVATDKSGEKTSSNK
ncbi:MAG: hypothetical protein HC831_00280 [Chloroflexia bacterium]|nr:hypothetical protein [Chloroflexia bacterium]